MVVVSFTVTVSHTHLVDGHAHDQVDDGEAAHNHEQHVQQAHVAVGIVQRLLFFSL